MLALKKKFLFFLFIYTILSFYTIGFVPIFESTEARYAEIAREMLENGNYIEPYFNGIKHFHKPPLTYWLIACGLKLFGINNFGARFFGIIASIFTFIYTVKLSKFFIRDNERYFSAYILGSSILFLAVSKIAATDIYLTLWTVMVQYYYFEQVYGTKSSKNAILLGVFLGLGFMTKGPIIFIFTILPFLISKIFDVKFRKVFNIKEITLTIIFFLLTSLPWYIIVILKNYELLQYFFKVQTLDRVTTNRFNREKPFYFFIGTILLSSLPYSLLVIHKIKLLYLNYKRYLILLIYIIVPFIIFSISKSKLHTYLTPLTPIMSIFIFKFYKDYFNIFFNKFVLLILVILPTVLLIGTLFYEQIRFNTTIIMLSIIALIFILFSKNKKDSFHFSYNIALITLIIFNIFYYSTSLLQSKLMGFENMVKMANSIDPERKLESVCYKKDLPSVSFYRNKIAIMAFGNQRETQFEKDDNYKKYYIQSENEMKGFIQNNKEFFLFTRGLAKEFQEKYKIKCEERFLQRDYSLSLCKN